MTSRLLAQGRALASVACLRAALLLVEVADKISGGDPCQGLRREMDEELKAWASRGVVHLFLPGAWLGAWSLFVKGTSDEGGLL